LLVMTMMSSSPAWAFSLANHGCCAPKVSARQAETKPAVSGKHAHCAAMAANAAQTSLPAGPTVTALHSCHSCAMGAMLSPRSAAYVVATQQIWFSTRYQFATAQPRFRSLQYAANRDQRGPPSIPLPI